MGGRLLESSGGEIRLEFADARSAAAAAFALQAGIRHHNDAAHSGSQLLLRMGIEAGAAVPPGCALAPEKDLH